MQQEAPVNKSDLIDTVANATDVAKGQVENVLSAFFDNLTTSVKGGDKVSWPGFGSFSMTQRKARMGRNLRTGAPMKIGASKAMKFTSSSVLKEAMNSKGRGTKKAAPAKKAAGKKATGKKAPARKAGTAKKASKATKKR
jgi:DNA-binding protein HU-beta